MSRSGQETGALWLTIVLALALRLHRLGDQNVWWDEGYSVWVARQGLWQGALATAYDVHPPLYYWLLHFWRAAAGESEWALRYLSLLLGVLMVPLTYRLGRALGWRGAGAVAALFVAISRFGVMWSQEMRMYTLATALGLASTLLALRLWQRGRGLCCYALVSAALLHSLYLGAVFLAVQNAFWLLLLWRGQRRWWRRWPAAQVSVALLMLPWLSLFLPRLRHWSVAEPIGLGRFLYYYWGVLSIGTTVNIERQAPQMAALALAFAVAVAFLARSLVSPRKIRTTIFRTRETRGTDSPCVPVDSCRGRPGDGHKAPSPSSGQALGYGLVVAAVLPPLLVFALAQPHGFFYSPRPEPRYLNPFAAFVYLLWAAGLVAAWRWHWPLGLGLALLSLGGLALPLPAHYLARYLEDDYRSIACTLETYAQPEDLVLLHTDSDWPVFAYHYERAWQGVPNNVAWDGSSAAGFLGQYLPEQQVAWLVLTTDAIRADPGMAIEAKLAQWCAEGECRRQEWRFGERRLVRFGRGSPLPAPSLAAARPTPGLAGVVGAWWPYRRGRSASSWQAYIWQEPRQGPLPALSLYHNGTAVAMAEASTEGDDGGGLRRLAYRLSLPAPGEYSVRLGYGAENRTASFPSGETGTLTSLRVGALPTMLGATVAGQRQALGAVFADKVALEGFALSSQAPLPGRQLCVALFWRAEAPVSQPYVVFVHLLGQTYNATQGNFLWGQHDGQPADGLRPLPTWQPGELVEDSHCFTVDTQAPPGPYLIEVGLYDRTSGQRLPVTAGGQGDRIIATGVEVRETGDGRRETGDSRQEIGDRR